MLIMKEKKPLPTPKSTPKRKPLKDEDVALWVAATGDSKTIAPQLKPHKRANIQNVQGIITLESFAVPISSHHPSSFQVDRNLKKKFEKGDLPIEARIDLHGLTLSEAHHRFITFITRQIKIKSRCVLVITGKGSTESENGRGILRKNLPLWCEDAQLKPHILQMTSAAPKHGGQGASYILLRR
jgi:DNA-nicking Smr family endonuclease